MKGGRGKRIVLVLGVPVAVFALIVSGRVLSVRSSSTTECSEPTFEPDGRAWAQFPPAAVVQSSDGCVGYCFNAVVESETDQNSGIAHVMVVGEDGALTRGVVDRSRVSSDSLMPVLDGEPVRFACFESFADAGGAPLFDDCVQMAASRIEDPECATASQAISDASQHHENEFDMFLFGL